MYKRNMGLQSDDLTSGASFSSRSKLLRLSEPQFSHL